MGRGLADDFPDVDFTFTLASLLSNINIYVITGNSAAGRSLVSAGEEDPWVLFLMDYYKTRKINVCQYQMRRKELPVDFGLDTDPAN